MSNFSKIVIIIILILTFFFIKEKTGFEFDNILSLLKLQKVQKEQNVIIKEPVEFIKKEEPSEIINVYFLALDKNSNGIYKKVKREVPQGDGKLNFAITELLKGPNDKEKIQGAYSEIPSSTKLIDIKESEDKIIINLSADFQYGGGTDSIYSRMMQLIKTSIENSDNKKIYLYLNGKQIKLIGGEGIMISQPLSEKSLEI